MSNMINKFYNQISLSTFIIWEALFLFKKRWLSLVIIDLFFHLPGQFISMETIQYYYRQSPIFYSVIAILYTLLTFGLHLLIVFEILYQAQKDYKFSILSILRGSLQKIKLFFATFIVAVLVTIPYYILLIIPGLVRSIELLLFGPLVVFDDESVSNINPLLKKSEQLMYGYGWTAFFGLFFISVPLLIPQFYFNETQMQMTQFRLMILPLGLIWFNLSICFIVRLYFYIRTEKNEVRA